ncbi:MAG: flagellar export protein FliJ [Nitrospiraceae bacterium]|nr:MAG: flagellar export protein FliJ [Nitrospiraceae bacterium]
MNKKKTLSKMLKLKDGKKAELEMEVKRAADRADKEEQRLNSLENAFAETLSRFSQSSLHESTDVSSIHSYYDFFARINGSISEQQKIHDERQNELESLKNCLIDAHKDKKAFEILNERETKKQQKDQVSAEQKEADFLTLARRLK